MPKQLRGCWIKIDANSFRHRYKRGAEEIHFWYDRVSKKYWTTKTSSYGEKTLGANFKTRKQAIQNAIPFMKKHGGMC